MIFDKLFQLMAEKQASDLFITAGAPIHIKIQGHTMPINQQVMEPPMIERMVYEMMKPEQIAQFERDKELNLSHGVKTLGNFRINTSGSTCSGSATASVRSYASFRATSPASTA